MQNVATRMKRINWACEVDVSNANDYMTRSSQKVKNFHNFSKTMDVEYTSFLDEQRHALARRKQDVSFWKKV